MSSDEWVATVMPSPLDARVWCVILPETDMMTGALHASTSLRRCKRYAEQQVRTYLGSEADTLRWSREGSDWQAHLTPEPPATDAGPTHEEGHRA